MFRSFDCILQELDNFLKALKILNFKGTELGGKQSSQTAGVKASGMDQSCESLFFNLLLQNFKQVCIFHPEMRITEEM